MRACRGSTAQTSRVARLTRATLLRDAGAGGAVRAARGRRAATARAQAALRSLRAGRSGCSLARAACATATRRRPRSAHLASTRPVLAPAGIQEIRGCGAGAVFAALSFAALPVRTLSRCTHPQAERDAEAAVMLAEEVSARALGLAEAAGARRCARTTARPWLTRSSRRGCRRRGGDSSHHRRGGAHRRRARRAGGQPGRRVRRRQ
jgi:hypothetical protein